MKAPDACSIRGFLGTSDVSIPVRGWRMKSSRCLFEFLKPVFEIVLRGSHFDNVAAQLP